RVGLVQLGLGAAPVVLEGPAGGDHHHGAGGKAGHPALDIQELLGTQVGTESGFGDYIICQLQAQLGGNGAVAAVCNVGKCTAVDDGGIVFQGLDQVGVQGVLEQGGHGTGGADLSGSHRLAVIGVGADDPAQPLFQVLQVGGQAEDGHDLAGYRNIKAVLPGS